ncbi:zinc-dependent metalloprotease [Actinotignum urinale]|uniref:Zinc-dependent metalloprotease n=1 Tax=Actinotignum urinale TaxID=190146 RepID=A0ABU5G9U3_9ACTO|nr:zinc-dependent metalloprotease [Actinotignum urinale]MDY5132866.1 zinc-dependent metalloprotease [Actinotignum urinale]MDY5151630.1 zinc-dependent metalloprotease [Actinotignum urinale]WIK59366.1 zinc-dependent metalloprotease [Actinotignum urinale]
MSDQDKSREEWENMLRSIMGDNVADEVIRSLDETNKGNSENAHSGNLPPMFLDSNGMQLIGSFISSLTGNGGKGPINWKMGDEVARHTVLHNAGDGKPTAEQCSHAKQAMNVANLWVDPVTNFGPINGTLQVWSRLDWVAHSLPTFKKLTGPVGENIARAFEETLTAQLEDIPEDMKDNLFGGSQLFDSNFIVLMISSLLAVQFGKGLGDLATVAFGSTDTGIPLVEGETTALVPANIDEFSDSIQSDLQELQLYVAVREIAAARLYSSVPWLRTSILDAVAAYAGELTINVDAIQERAQEMGFDPHSLDMDNIGTGMGMEVPAIDLGDLFIFDTTEAQQKSLAHVEHLLSLAEGWVSCVTRNAVASQLPHATILEEAFVRREATDSPMNRVFGALIGTDVSPRRISEATAFWMMATDKLGINEREKLWNHPDILPQPEDLENPEKFFETQKELTDIEAELDSFLEEVLNAGLNGTSGKDFGNHNGSDHSNSDNGESNNGESNHTENGEQDPGN